MNHQIPRLSRDCRYCQSEQATGPCSDHPDGADYTGPELYHPSEWIQSLLGQRFGALWGEIPFRCTGYDPRAGIWMEAVDGSRRTNISERAVGATWHRLSMKWGAWRLLELVVANGGPMVSREAAEAANILFDLARETLLDNGLVEQVGDVIQLSNLGQKVVTYYSDPKERNHLQHIDFAKVEAV